MTPTQDRVLSAIRRSWPHAITKAMCEPISKRSFEAAVRDLRLAGHPIASNGEGYWYATLPSEIRDTAAALRRRLAHQAETLRAMEATAERMELAGMGATTPSLWGDQP